MRFFFFFFINGVALTDDHNSNKESLLLNQPGLLCGSAKSLQTFQNVFFYVIFLKYLVNVCLDRLRISQHRNTLGICVDDKVS